MLLDVPIPRSVSANGLAAAMHVSEGASHMNAEQQEIKMRHQHTRIVICGLGVKTIDDRDIGVWFTSIHIWLCAPRMRPPSPIHPDARSVSHAAIRDPIALYRAK